MRFRFARLNVVALSAVCLTGTTFGQWTNSSSNAYLTDSTKKVSIGRKVFTNKLDVNGNMAIGAGYAGISAAPTDGMIIKGVTGIGTPTIEYQFRVQRDDGLGNGEHYIGDFVRSGATDAKLVFGYRANGSAATATLIRAANNLPLVFGTSSTNQAVTILNNGNMGIGTTSPASFKLAVEGKIGAREVVVTQAAWSDFVFKPDYNLKPLDKVAEYVKKNHHLEGIPTESEVKKNGVPVGEMQAKLLQKIEEITLYLVDLKEENKQLKAKVADLEQKVGR